LVFNTTIIRQKKKILIQLHFKLLSVCELDTYELILNNNDKQNALSDGC